MSTYLERIADRLRDTEEDLRREVEDQQARWRYQLRLGRAWFDRERHEAHRRLRQGVLSWVREGSVLSLLTAPLIYSLVIPLFLLDVWVTGFQWLCFPIYGIARVPRRQYFVLDRHRLAYLNGIEKLHCTYCSYAGGLLAYVREVAARTEQYWCPIKHSRAIPAPHDRYHYFFGFGDARGYREGLPALRRTLRPEAPEDERRRPGRDRHRASSSD